MTSAEIRSNLEPAQLRGYELAMAREQLGLLLGSENPSRQTYEELLGKYLDAFSDLHFSEPADEERFIDMTGAARLVKTDVECLTREKTFEVIDIETHLLGRFKTELDVSPMTDEYDALKMATAGTLADLIETHAPHVKPGDA
jgi:hypothetical protein